MAVLSCVCQMFFQAYYRTVTRQDVWDFMLSFVLMEISDFSRTLVSVDF